MPPFNVVVVYHSPNNTDSGEGAMTPIMLKESREINVSMQWGANKTLMSQQFCSVATTKVQKEL